MMKAPFLSIIMPMYNAEEYLESAISSILKQSFRDFELIVVNDQSKDKSESICKEYQEKDPRVKLITVEKNGGAGNARNIGMKVATGEFITFMDSDDVIDNDLYLKAYEMLKENDLDMVVWGITEEYYDNDGNLYCENQLYLPKQVCCNIDEIKDTVIQLEEKTMFGYQWNRFYRASILREHNIQFEKVILYEDYFFNLEFIKYVNRMGVLDIAGYHYMKRPNESITTRYVPEYFELSKRRIDSMYQLYESWNGCDDNVKNILGERYLRYILAGLTKSYDRKANSSSEQRKRWLENVKNDELYAVLVKNCEVKQKVLKCLQVFINKENWGTCMLMGQCVACVKDKLPKVFNRIRKFK